MTTTAAVVLMDTVELGMDANGWPFEVAFKAACSALGAVDPAALTELAFHSPVPDSLAEIVGRRIVAGRLPAWRS